jgi:4-alpha-glucanotransferase
VGAPAARCLVSLGENVTRRPSATVLREPGPLVTGHGEGGLPLNETLPGVTDLSRELAELAAAHGVATEYWDWQGNHIRVSAETVADVLTALGVPATSPDEAVVALREHRLGHWRRMLPSCVVARSGSTARFWVHVRHGDPVEVWVELESGGMRHGLAQLEHLVDPVFVDGVLVGEAAFQLPADLPLGWHALHARSPRRYASVPLVVTPAYLGLPERMHDHRAWGFMAQLYTVRSRRSWGLGDLADLADLAAWSGHRLGAGFVLVNPLHAAGPVVPMEPSPYLPTTRRFANPIYLRVEEVAEFGYLGAADRAAADRLAAEQRRRNTTDEPLDRDGVWAAKQTVLEQVHAVPLTPGRQAAYDAFRCRESQGLVDFATWCALAEEHGLPWQDWPAELHDPRSRAVAEARKRLVDRVDFHTWLQWVLDEQLARAHRIARDAGMTLGVLHDLAVGVHSEGADSWALQDVLAHGINVGAPPDAFNQLGQNWSQPPWHPQRLADVGYAPYRDMLRTVLRHAGGVRVDHVLGLFRLWWVPEGRPPDEGTYVRYDHEALVGILALEAHRAGGLVVGEDLGVVEPWVRGYLTERGILGTSILWFERDYAAVGVADDTGRPLPPERWRPLCLATVTTHDLPPTAGYLTGEHIRIRHELGLLTRSLEEEQAVTAAELESWLNVLADMGLLPPAAGEREVVEALHRYLTRTPCRLLGVSLPDAIGDRRAINQPGTSHEYPNWRMPLAGGDGRPVLLEDISASERARSLARTVL